MPFEPMARAREEELAGTRRLFGVRPLLTVLDGAPSRGLSFSRWNRDTRRFFCCCHTAPLSSALFEGLVAENGVQATLRASE